MQDYRKTKDQLTDELTEMRRKVGETEAVQKSLNEKESRYFQIADKTNEAIFVIQDGWIKYANQKSSEIVGYSIEEALASNAIETLVHPDDREMVAQYHAGRIQGDETHNRYAFRIVCKDNRLRWVEMNSSLIMWEGRPAALCLMADITERKQAETTLLERERDFRSLLETIPDALVVYDEGGKVTFVNKAFEELYGWSQEELSGKPLDNFVPPSEEQIARQSWERTLRGENVVFETWRWTKKGKVLDLQLSTAILRDVEGKHTASIMIHRDITARKRAEEELQKSEQKYRQIFDYSPLGILHFDYEGTIAACNDNFVQIIGSSREKLVGLNMINDLKDFQIITAVKRALSGEIGHYEGEYASVTADKVIPVKVDFSPLLEESGTILGGIGIIEDITERKRAEDALRKGEEKYRLLAENTLDVIWQMDLDLRFTYVNPAIFQVTGYTPDEWIGTRLAEHCDEENFRKIAQVVSEEISKGTDSWGAIIEAEMLKKSRQPFSVEIYGKIIFGKNGLPVALQGITRDITERKRAEISLKETSTFLDTLLEAIPLPIFYKDTDGLFTGFNKAFEEFYGKPKQELVGKSVFDIYPEELAKVYYAKDNELFRNPGIQIYNTPIKDGRGVVHDIIFHNSTYLDSQGHVLGLIGVILDVTEPNRIREELQRNEFRFSRAEIIGRLGNWEIDLSTKRVTASDGARRIYGVGQQELTLEDIREFPLPDFRSPLNEALRALIKDGTPYDIEFQIKRENDNQVIDIHSIAHYDAEKNTVFGTIHDITNLRHAEESHKLLFEAMEHSAEAIIITDSTGTIQYVNPAQEIQSGYSRNELLGQTPNIFRSDFHDDNFYDKLWKTIKSGNVWSGRFVNRKKDGTVYHEDATISPVYTKTRKLKNFVAVKHDMTAHLKLSEQLFQAQKMEAVGTLAGGVAHDFNNLLQAILGYSELMLQRKKDGERDYADLQKIYQAGKRGADLVESLLTFSRKAETKYVPLNLNHEITQVQQLLSRTIPKTISMDLHLKGNLESIKADRSQIGQVLMNLGVNARDAMPDGGILTIETTNIRLDEEYCNTHPEAEPGSYVLLTVSDNGQGMDKKTVSHIFEPFFTTKETGKGTGLGLATVYGIVKQHGGHITCNSEFGLGTTFKIYFPSIEKERDSETPTIEKPIQGGTETILLVDDEEALRELGSTLLSEFGYKVITAGNGKEALGIYQNEGERISLVVLDLTMPEMDGKKCMQEILQINPNAKVVLASGHSESGLANGNVTGRAKAFVQKPCNMSQLLTTIREVIYND